MLKRITSIIGCLCLMVALVGCSEKYNEEDILGHTSNEIVDIYGEFNSIIGIEVPDENEIATDCEKGPRPGG